MEYLKLGGVVAAAVVAVAADVVVVEVVVVVVYNDFLLASKLGYLDQDQVYLAVY